MKSKQKEKEKKNSKIRFVEKQNGCKRIEQIDWRNGILKMTTEKKRKRKTFGISNKFHSLPIKLR